MQAIFEKITQTVTVHLEGNNFSVIYFHSTVRQDWQSFEIFQQQKDCHAPD